MLKNFAAQPRPEQKALKTKATQQQKRDWLAALILWATYTGALSKALAPTLYALINETGQDAMRQVGQQPGQFDPTTAAVMSYYQARADKIAADVNAETEKQLRASLGQGVDDDESSDQMRARIELVFGAALTYRADRITTTETTRAQGWADVEAWKQAGNVTGKQWNTAADERVCPFCRSLDGTIISLDSNFLSLGDVLNVDGQSLSINYEDVGSPPEHANCRCTLDPVIISA